MSASPYLSLLQSHYRRLFKEGIDCYGADRNRLWLASMDIVHGGQSANPDPRVKRAYRNIHSPRGSNLYWDQPCVAAAYNLSRINGDSFFRDNASGYVSDFLERCVSPENGLFLWGNHIYYDVFEDRIVSFSGGYHEVRPLPCAWELFWEISPEKTERCIRSIGLLHIKDPQSGVFDRHADPAAVSPSGRIPGSYYPFLEAGGVIIESLCWLARKTGDHTLVNLALKVARYSYSSRDSTTGLLRNQSGPHQRWDYHNCTTEVGHWANCLFRAAAASSEEEFIRMARESVRAYLVYGFDPDTERYFGQLARSTGLHRVPDESDLSEEDNLYQPGKYADLWEPLFPTHNYPMCLAEAALTLALRESDPIYDEAVGRFIRFIELSLPANEGRGAYADQYGRVIRFLARCARELEHKKALALAHRVAEEAVTRLFVSSAGMFRSHPGEDRADAVDGLGILFLALISLETGNEPDSFGFGW